MFVARQVHPEFSSPWLELLRALEAGVRIRVVVTDYRRPAVDSPADVPVVERWLSEHG